MSHHPVRSYKKRKRFLDALASGFSLSSAAAKAGGTVGEFNRWRKEDSCFEQDWDEAVESGTDYIEDRALERAIEKSDPLMQMILKARRPEKYDRGSKLEVSGGISLDGSKSRLLNKIARLQAQGEVLAASRETKPGILSTETALALPAPRISAFATGEDPE